MEGMRNSPLPQSVLTLPAGRDILFTADLHLALSQPEGVARATAFISRLNASHWVILGDLFHLYWGADCLRNPAWEPVLTALRRLTRGCRVFFCPGNRDFLVGPEFQARTGVRVIGETLLCRLGDQAVYACHGDQLARDDLPYQCMKLIIRNPVLRGVWRCLPSALRRRLSGELRSVTVRHLDRKTPAHLMPARDVLVRIFKRGARTIVSGHRHAKQVTDYTVAGRQCRHYELPAWSERPEGLLYRDGVFSWMPWQQEART